VLRTFAAFFAGVSLEKQAEEAFPDEETPAAPAPEPDLEPV
jgi:hypothetical protein